MEVKRILVPFTAKAVEEETLMLVCRFARALGAHLSVVYVLEVPLSLPMDASDVPGLKEAEQVLERAEQIARKSGMRIRTGIFQARDVGVGIVEEAEADRADLIVMSGHWDARHPDSPIGHTLRYVLKHAQCLVWVICAPMQRAANRK